MLRLDLHAVRFRIVQNLNDLGTVVVVVVVHYVVFFFFFDRALFTNGPENGGQALIEPSEQPGHLLGSASIGSFCFNLTLCHGHAEPMNSLL